MIRNSGACHELGMPVADIFRAYQARVRQDGWVLDDDEVDWRACRSASFRWRIGEVHG